MVLFGGVYSAGIGYLLSGSSSLSPLLSLKFLSLPSTKQRQFRKQSASVKVAGKLGMLKYENRPCAGNTKAAAKLRLFGLAI